jgi:hypothetical protein
VSPSYYSHICPHCGKSFQSRYKVRRFCGPSCQGKARRHNRTPEEDRARWRRLYHQRQGREAAPELVEWTCDHLSDLECAYIAGLIDGEGTLTTRSYASYYSFNAYLVIQMSDQRTIEWLAERLQQNAVTQLNQRPGWKTQFKIALGGKNAEKLICRLRPYMITKRPHADLMVEFMTAEDDRRRQIKEELRVLNRRGE